MCFSVQIIKLLEVFREDQQTEKYANQDSHRGDGALSPRAEPHVTTVILRTSSLRKTTKRRRLRKGGAASTPTTTQPLASDHVGSRVSLRLRELVGGSGDLRYSLLSIAQLPTSRFELETSMVGVWRVYKIQYLENFDVHSSMITRS